VFADVSRVLDALAALLDYPLVVQVAGGLAERWTGVRRSQRATMMVSGRALEGGAVALVARDGVPILTLAPLFQVQVPTPGAPLDLFLFEGRGRHGAKLVALPHGFEHHDEELWDWFRAHLSDSLDESRGDQPEARAPYRGLSPFTHEDAALFFGREKLVDAFVNRLRVQPLLAVVGRSGAGKSSFALAGVIPMLPAGWRALVMRPGAAPLSALTSRLQHAGIEVGPDDDGPALVQAMRIDGDQHGTVVLVVDQLEELFTLCTDEDERVRFAEVLAAASRTAEDPVRVICTLRDDFLLRAEQLASLRNRIGQGLQLLTVPAEADLLRILTEPARLAGYDFEDAELPGEMVREVADQPGALALLSFTALELWQRRDRHFRQLTRRAYRELGGVGGALAQHAEQTLEGMPPESRGLTREAFRHLVTSENTRAVLRRDELIQLLGGGPHAEQVIEHLVAARLLVTSENEAGGDDVEIVHEALLTAWPRLVTWRGEDQEGRRFHEQLRAAARQWDDRGRPRGLLWRGDALAELSVWRARHQPSLTRLEDGFAAASNADSARGRRVRRTVVAAAIVVLTVAVAVLARLNTVAKRERSTADRERSRAEELQHDAEQRVIAQHEEQGRQALLAGDSLRAAVYLSAAFSAGADDPGLRYLLGRALRPLEAEVGRLQGHTRPVGWLALSPDGRTLVTASEDRTARLWNVADQRPMHTLEGATNVVARARFDAAGQRVVTASADGKARVYDRDGRLVATLTGHQTMVTDASFDPGGGRVLTASYDGTARVWDAGTGAQLAQLDARSPAEWAGWSRDGRWLAACGGERWIRIWDGQTLAHRRDLDSGTQNMTCAFSPDGKLLATAGVDRTARLWDVERGVLVRTLSGHTHAVDQLAFSPDGAVLATGSQDNTARLWRVADGELLASLVGHSAAITAVRFDPAGRRLATTSRDGTARYYDVEAGILLGVFEGHVDPVSAAAFDGAGDRLFTAGADGTVRIWDLRRLNTVSLRGDALLGAVAFGPDGTRIVTSGESGAQVWDLASGRRIASVGSGGQRATFDGRAQRVVTAGFDGSAAIWAAGDGTRLASLDGHVGAVASARFSPDGQQVVTSDDAGARVWTAEGVQVALLPHPQPVIEAAFSPDGTRVLTTCRDGNGRLWDRSGWQLRAPLEGHRDWVEGGEFSPDGRAVVTRSKDGTARLWDATSGRLLYTLEGHAGPIWSAHFDHTGARVVTTSADLTARIWDAASGRLLGVLSRHDLLPWNAAFSPDGNFVATASLDRTVAIWDAHTFRMLDRLKAHTGWVFDVAWAPAGDRLVSVSADHTALVWSFSLEHRSPAEIGELIRCRVPYHLDGGSLIRVVPDCGRGVNPGAAPDR